MNITVKVDEVTLDSVVAEFMAYDDETGPYQAGERTVADVITEQIVARLVKEDGYRSLTARVLDIRSEVIREAVRPQIDEAITKPFRQTNSYGEPSGPETTLSEVIVAEARKMMTHRDSYDRGQTAIEKIVAAELQKALTKEVADAVKEAREQVAGQIGQQVADAVAAGMRKR